jgi:predicted GNAT family acetyltransferase
MKKMRRPTYRLIKPQDSEAVQTFLSQDPILNLYLIHGYATRASRAPTDTEFWGAWYEGQLIAMLYVDHEGIPKTGYLAGSSSDLCVTQQVIAHLSTLAVNKLHVGSLTGPKSYVEPAFAKLGKRARVTNIHLYRADPARIVRHNDYPVRPATRADLPQLIKLYREYEFRRRGRSDTEIAREIEHAMSLSGTYFVLEWPGDSPGREPQLICVACIYPETDQVGVIGAARTLPEYRGRGIYPSVRTAAFEHLFSQGKIGIGFIVDSNTSMHRVLEKQGGTILGDWWTVHIRPKLSLKRRVRRRVRKWRQLVLHPV